MFVVDAADRVVQLTAPAESAVADLGGWDSGSLPTSLLMVVAAARAGSGSAQTVAPTVGGRWLRLRAARLTGPAGTADVVVTVDPTPRQQLSRFAPGRARADPARGGGGPARAEAPARRRSPPRVALSPHTVQDHLKKIFGKVGGPAYAI